jgi:ubiquinone/menaquinone biosynthesis C-methylase UbiE
MSSPKPRAQEAEWYNEHYKARVDQLSPWYRFLIPQLVNHLGPDSSLLELGCGQGQLLEHLVQTSSIVASRIHAIDQSQTAVDIARGRVPGADIRVGDIYDLQFPSDSITDCVMMETIEHIEQPDAALREILRVIAPGGRLFLSFPNFLHLPWLGVRLLSDLLNKPSWIVRQPIDKVYTVFSVIRLVDSAGFKFERGVGSNYGPPVFYRLETDTITRYLNRVGLWRLSFHPVLVFRK